MKSPAAIAPGRALVAKRDRKECLKPAVTVAQEDRDTVGAGIGDGQVDHAVAEVARHDRRWVRPRWIKDRGLESAVAVAHQDRHALSVAVVSTISDSHVEAAVAVKIGHSQSGRLFSRGE